MSGFIDLVLALAVIIIFCVIMFKILRDKIPMIDEMIESAKGVVGK